MKMGIVLGNRILDVAFIAACIAQFYKVVSPVLRGKGFQFHRLFQTGGMPSSHSSTVTALATSVALVDGVHSIEFAIACILGTIVMYDATGVRRAAGKQAGVLNKLMISLKSKYDFKEFEANLKELLGHEPIEVLFGAILGILTAYLFRSYILA